MTLSYVKRPEEFRKMKADKYFSKTGEAELAEWLKENLQTKWCMWTCSETWYLSCCRCLSFMSTLYDIKEIPANSQGSACNN